MSKKTDEKKPTDGFVVTFDNGVVRMRSEPNDCAEVLALVPDGGVVAKGDGELVVTGEETWQPVKYDNMAGYMMIKYLK